MRSFDQIRENISFFVKLSRGKSSQQYEESAKRHFDDLFLEVCEFAKQLNPILGKIWREEKFPVTTDVLRVLGASVYEEKYFESSGTTSFRSRIPISTTELYDHWAPRFFYGVFPEIPLLSWVPSFEEKPHSSLAHMISILGEVKYLAAPEVLTKPFVLLTTTAHLAENIEKLPRFPGGSWIMDTGGFKSSRKVLSLKSLYQEVLSRTGVKPQHLIQEYGMSEAFSQAYDCENLVSDPWDRWKIPNLTADVSVIDPWTGSHLEDGTIGQLVWRDLLNTHTYPWIATGDSGIKRGRAFKILGRLEAMDPKGCSAMVPNVE